MTARQRAGDLLAFYISSAWEAAGLEFTGENLAEARSVADALADAAGAECALLRADLDALIRNYRLLAARVDALQAPREQADGALAGTDGAPC